MNQQFRLTYPRNYLISNDSKNNINFDSKDHYYDLKQKLNKKGYQADKENISDQQNIQHKNVYHKSPKNTKAGIKQLQIRSPDRPIYMPSGFRSNKANQCVIDIEKEISKANQIMVIYSGVSKDEKFKIVSKAFTGKQLQSARIYQEKHNQKVKQKKQAEYLSLKDIPNIQQSKFSHKQIGLIKSYAVNTHQGISRNYNEDRVSVILNINKHDIKSTFFAIYDGHGGTGCCDFLRDYLHQYVINSTFFPSEPKKALIEGIHKTENKFLQLVKRKFMKTNILDRSGSCAVIVMIIKQECFVVNIGDSRAFLSKNNGRMISHLSRDHKPSDQKEQNRIIENGGKVYRTEMTRLDKLNIKDKSKLAQNQYIIGPLRVYPGKLSVTRTFGDIQAKDKDFQGLPNCVTVQPQIAKFQISKSDDFLFLGCDGIFEKLESVQINKLIWKVIRQKQNKDISIHNLSGKCVDQIIRESMRRKSTDNLTGIMINLKQNFTQMINQNQKTLVKNLSCRSI